MRDNTKLGPDEARFAEAFGMDADEYIAFQDKVPYRAQIEAARSARREAERHRDDVLARLERAERES